MEHYFQEAKIYTTRKAAIAWSNTITGLKSLWFLRYNWKTCLVDDIIAGLTIAIMQIPQGMAYAMLANVPPEMGIYCSIFPVLLYGLVGPSGHISIGTCGPLCLLVASVMGRHLSEVASRYSSMAESRNLTDLVDYENNPPPPLVNVDTINDSNLEAILERETVSMATTLCLLTGLWQIILAAVNLGRFSWILSDVVMSAYTTGAAIHVFTSQLKALFGLKFPRRNSSYLKLVYTYTDFFSHVSETNPITLLIGLATFLVLVFHDFVLKPEVSKMCRFPIPIQLIVVVGGTAISHVFDFQNKYKVDVVGQIPSGFPAPTIPQAQLMPSVLVDSMILAIVGYSISLSLAQLFANKFHYELNANTQLFTEGLSNIVGSFFRCIPAAGSMARSMVLLSVGGKTQLSGLVSALILILVLLFIGPVFQSLPKAVLSAIIVVALKGMFIQTRDFRAFFAKSRLDGFLWLGTFLGVVFTNVDVGLVIAVALTVFVMAYRSYDISVVETNESSSLLDKTGMGEGSSVILSIRGVMTFANVSTILKKSRKVLRRKMNKAGQDASLKKVVLELSCVPYVDQMAAKAIKDWMDDIKSEGLSDLIWIFAPQDEVREMLLAIGVADNLLFSNAKQMQSPMLDRRPRSDNLKDREGVHFRNTSECGDVPIATDKKNSQK